MPDGWARWMELLSADAPAAICARRDSGYEIVARFLCAWDGCLAGPEGAATTPALPGVLDRSQFPLHPSQIALGSVHDLQRDHFGDLVGVQFLQLDAQFVEQLPPRLDQQQDLFGFLN